MAKASTHDTIGQDTDADSPGQRTREQAARDLPDPARLALDWITLWQSELTAMAADRELRETWQTVAGLWAGTMATLVRGMPHAQAHDAAARPAGAPQPPRTTAADAASDPRDAEIERLARHVAALERRLADIERGGRTPVHPRRDPKRTSRK